MRRPGNAGFQLRESDTAVSHIERLGHWLEDVRYIVLTNGDQEELADPISGFSNEAKDQFEDAKCRAKNCPPGTAAAPELTAGVIAETPIPRL